MAKAETILIKILTQDQTKAGTAEAKSGLAGLLDSGAAVGLGYAAIAGAAVKFGVDSVKAAGDAEKAVSELEDAYQKFNATHDVTLSSFEKLSQQLQDTTRFSRESADAAETQLMQFGLTGKQIEDLLPLVADYAAKTGKDLPDAATTLGKALLGNTRAEGSRH